MQKEEEDDSELEVIIQALMQINGMSDGDRLDLIKKLTKIFEQRQLFARKDINKGTFLDFLKWYPTTEPIEISHKGSRGRDGRRNGRRDGRSMRDGRDDRSRDRRDNRSRDRRGNRESRDPQQRVINQPYSYDELFF